MRHRPTVLTALVVGAALTLAGCGGEDPGDAEAGQSAPAGELPTVAGSFGEEPTITFPDSGAPQELETEVLEEGDGAEVGPDDFVVADYQGQVWGQDETFDSSFTRPAPTGFSLNGVIPGWKEGLTGTHVGDRVLLAIPSDLGYGAQGTPDGSIPPDSDLTFVVDVRDVYPPDASGQADADPVEPAPDLPVTVDGELGGAATVTVDEGAAEPTEAAATVVATGDGEPVAAEEGVLIQYALSSWDNGTQESTWDTDGVTSITVGQGTVFDLLQDVPVGSRVVIQVPGTPASGQSAEQPAMAAVVDIVATIPPR